MPKFMRDPELPPKDDLPTTPEGWVQWEEREITELRAAGTTGWGCDFVTNEHGEVAIDDRPEYDNFRLWVVFMRHKGALPGRNSYAVAEHLPRFLRPDGSVDIAGIARQLRYTELTIQDHLKALKDLIGGDFRKVLTWPHPLA